MRLKTPKFWYRPFGLKAAALFFPSQVYGIGRNIHRTIVKPYKTKITVICVGNIVAGGSGKTPVALAIAQIVKDGIIANKPCFLSRGYGRKTKDLFLVNKDNHTAEDVGDEALLLTQRIDTIIAGNRKKGAMYAEKNEYDLVIMDDGMQNPGLHKDISFMVINGATGFGNGQLLPAGPLREKLSDGYKRTDAFVVIGEDKTGIFSKLPSGKPVFNAQLKVPDTWLANKDSPYLAFCGLGHPEKFRKTLRETGLNVVGWHPYPDHYNFTASDLHDLAEKARDKNARMITTAKDAARIPAQFARELPLDILPVEITWDDREALTTFLKEKIGKA